MIQTPLIEVPPRSLQLTDNVWGIDPSTKRVAVAVVGPSIRTLGPQTFAIELSQLDRGARRLGAAYADLEALFRTIVHLTGSSPALIIVEQPFAYGRNVHPQSQYMIGVVLAALAAALGDVGIVDLRGPTKWKAAALGAGAGKADKTEILDWAREVAGYEGEDQDEADAVGIATAAGVWWLNRDPGLSEENRVDRA